LNSYDIAPTLLSCGFFMALVAVISFLKARGEVSARDEYFLAERGLTAVSSLVRCC
jgi:SSS family solute:Na+ symporter|tara:strand:- start:227 stop:394 length:168 start_codon:yes stop_codon:yes gene_type:complete